MKSLGALLALPVALVVSGAAIAGAQSAPAASKPTGDQQAAKKKRTRVVTDMSGFELLPKDKLEKQTTVVGATRSGLKPAPPIPLAPFLAKVVGEKPLFQWSGKSRQFTFALQDEAGAEVVRKTVAEARYRYDGPPLLAGKTYAWTVQAASGAASEAVSFQVADAKDRQAAEAALAKVKGEGYETELQRARIMGEHRLWYDAVGAYSDLILRHPDRAQAYEERGMILAQLPRTQAAAEEDFAKADALGGAAPR